MRDGGALQITSEGGCEYEIDALTLRCAAMDAVSKRERIDNGFVSVTGPVRITAINPVGTTGVNIQFSDGHQRAIYPYPYLSKLALSADN